MQDIRSKLQWAGGKPRQLQIALSPTLITIWIKVRWKEVLYLTAVFQGHKASRKGIPIYKNALSVCSSSRIYNTPLKTSAQICVTFAVSCEYLRDTCGHLQTADLQVTASDMQTSVCFIRIYQCIDPA